MSDANQSSRFSVSTVVAILVVLLLFAGLVWFVVHQRESIAAAEPGRGFLYRQFGDRGDGVGIYDGDQSGRAGETAEPDQARQRSTADYQVVHCFRSL